MSFLDDRSKGKAIGERRNVAALLLKKLTLSTEKAKHLRLKNAITAAIASGELSTGTQLPPEAELAAALSLSLGTVRRCLAGLVQEGIVTREHGRGTFVADQREALAELWTFRVLTDDGINLPIHTQQILDVALDGIWVQQDGRIVYANQEMATLLGTTVASELIGRVALDHIVSTDHSRVATRLHNVSGSSGSGGRIDFRIIGVDGALVDVEAVPLATMWCQQPAILIAARDVTEKKQAEAALKEKEGEFRHLIEMMADGALVHRDDQVVFVNNAGLVQFGAIDTSALIGRPIFDFIALDDRPLIRSTTKELYDGRGSALPIRFHGLRLDDRTVDLIGDASRITWEGRPAILMTLREPIALKQAEQALEESEERFQRILEALPAGVSIHHNQRIVYANPAQAELFGVDDPAKMIGCKFLDFFSPEEQVEMHERRRRILATGQPAPFSPRQVLQVGGGAVDIESTASLISWHGEPAVVGVCIDVTERNQLQQALRESEMRLQRVIDALSILISYVDAEQRYRLNNQAYERWFGHARDKFYGCHVRDVLGDAAYGAIRDFIERALDGETVTFESMVPYQDGGTRRVHATYVPDFGEDGTVKGFFSVVADITEPKTQ